VYNDLGAYAINETYSQQAGFPYSSTGLNGFVISGTAVDADVKKEKISTTEFGLNLEFFNRRAPLNAAYYDTETTDLITTATTAPSAGSNSILTNIGSIDGSGIELTLGLNPFRAVAPGDFNWDLNVNFTSSEQKVTSIQARLEEVQIDESANLGLSAVVGQQLPRVREVSYDRAHQGRIVVSEDTGNLIVGHLTILTKTPLDYIDELTNSFGGKGD